MKTRVTLPSITPAQRIKFPFLWASEQGCVYLRTATNQDIIVSPTKQMHLIGKVIDRVVQAWDMPGQTESDLVSWGKRLPEGSTVTLTQSYE